MTAPETGKKDAFFSPSNKEANVVAKRFSKSIQRAKRVKDLAIQSLQADRAKSVKGGCADGHHLQSAVQKVRE